MKQHSKLSQKQEHVVEQTAHAHVAKEFTNSDELLRFDAAQTAVPPEIARRLQESAAHLPPPKAVWWKRLFGGSSQ